LVSEFLKKNELIELDEKRQISDEEKIAVFAKTACCEMCQKEFKDYREAEYHHRERYADGGKSKMENIMVLCDGCHDRIHGKSPVELPAEDEIVENEE
jgi:5-methylcytosine-specific restriction endonuclease McrA